MNCRRSFGGRGGGYTGLWKLSFRHRVDITGRWSNWKDTGSGTSSCAVCHFCLRNEEVAAVSDVGSSPALSNPITFASLNGILFVLHHMDIRDFFGV